MTSAQKVIKYVALALAVALIVSIIGGIFSAIGLVSGFFGKSGVDDEMTVYEVGNEFRKLKIDINAAEVIFKNGEKFSVESNLADLRLTDNGETLKLTEKSKWGVNNSGAKLIVYIPEGHVFESVDLTAGAGRVELEALSAERLSMEFGAGEVKIGSLTAEEKAEIQGGAGKITIEGGSLSNLDFEMGVGEFNLKSELSGNCDLELGVGKTEIILTGESEKYFLDIDNGIGSITVDGSAINDKGVYGNGEDKIEIDGGVGAIKIDFE